ncbi:MAG: tRNA-dihydrouridine synthase [Firmicutes bacterium]|nr:tRNA-dihydrouridine synthase [Bacillota bacterium]
MQIAHLTIDTPIFAAPLAGFTTRAFREILRTCGAGLAYGEMVSAQALCYGNKRTRELLDMEGEAGLHVVQLFGSNPVYMEEAACIARELGADIIDINMGCPMPKVVNNGEGAALMRNLRLAASLVEAAQHSGLPVTVKLRSGFNETELNAPEAAKCMEAAGAALVAVHGRHREQYYASRADWSQITAVKQAVSIPVVGNGDIFTAKDALEMWEQTGCDAIMPGRGLLGNPWLIREILDLFVGPYQPLASSNQVKPSFSRLASPADLTPLASIISTALAHMRRQVERSIYWQGLREPGPYEQVSLQGELVAVRSMRAHLGYYIKGMPCAARLRAQINQMTRLAEIECLLEGLLDKLNHEC